MMNVLLSHEWPGNVRELENAIERAVVLAKGTELLGISVRKVQYMFSADSE